MKKVLSLLVVLCMMFSFVTFTQAADYALAINNNVALMVGNNKAIAWNTIVNLNQAPVEENGMMLAPVHIVASAFNGTVTAHGDLVLIDMGGERKIQMLVGNKNVVVNGQVFVSPVAPKNVNGQVLLPVEFLAEKVLGKFVYYDQATKVAVITQRKCLSSRDTEALNTIHGALTSGILPEIVVKAPVIEVDLGAFGGGVAAETGQLKFVNVSADQEPEPDNNAWCMVDGNLNSRWASQGAASAILDLGSAKPVTNVKVAVWKPAERNTNYGIEVSSDGATYRKIFDGASSGSTYDSYDVNDTIRYVRINTNGTSAGDWASILELEAWNGTAVVPSVGGAGGAAGTVSATAVGTKVNLSSSMLTATQTPEAENHAGNLVDGNKMTVWASQGDASVTINLGSSMTVSTVGVAMKMYEDDRTIPYDIEISTDGLSYTQVWSGNSEPMTDTTKYVSFSAPAKFVKITAHGNTISGWNSIGEIEVYSSGAATGVATTTTTTTSSATTTTANGTKLALTKSMLTISQLPEPENHEGNLIDGNKMTVWASQNEANVVIDLGSAKSLSAIGVAMKMYDDTRTIPYKIEVSADGTSYTEVWSGESDPQTDTTKYSSVTSSARYVRVTAYGNTVSGWNSIAEIEVYTK